MTIKHSLCTAALAVPLLVIGTGPSAADVDVGFGVGLGSPYYWHPYHSYPYSYGFRDPFYDPYDDTYFRSDVYMDAQLDDIDDEEVEVIEPAAAPSEPQGCVKTNVKNLKNACTN